MIEGLALDGGLTVEDKELISEALVQHKVLVIRDQKNMTVEDLREFTKFFGKLHVHLESSSHYRNKEGLVSYEDVNVVSNIRNEQGMVIGLYGRQLRSTIRILVGRKFSRRLRF